MKKYQKYPNKLKQKILERYQNGESAQKLAREYNLSAPVLIYQWLNKNSKNKMSKLDSTDKVAIENQYLRGQLKNFMRNFKLL